MSGWSPPSVPRNWLVVALALYAVVLAYAVVIVQRFLLAALVGALVASSYFLWRFLRAFEAIADAQQRMASAQEGESSPRRSEGRP